MPVAQPTLNSHVADQQLMSHMTNDTERKLVMAERPSNIDNSICSTAVLSESIILCVNVA